MFLVGFCVCVFIVRFACFRMASYTLYNVLHVFCVLAGFNVFYNMVYTCSVFLVGLYVFYNTYYMFSNGFIRFLLCLIWFLCFWLVLYVLYYDFYMLEGFVWFIRCLFCVLSVFLVGFRVVCVVFYMFLDGFICFI